MHSAAVLQGILLTPSYKVLGVPVHCLQIPDVIHEMESWIERRDQTHYIAITGMHGVSESRHDLRFRETSEIRFAGRSRWYAAGLARAFASPSN